MIRKKAAEMALQAKMLQAFQKDFFDKEKEQYKTRALGEFIANIQFTRQTEQQDNELTELFSVAKIG